MGLATYLRGSLLLPVLCVHFFLPVIWLLRRDYSHMLPRLAKLATGALIFAGLIAPWSLAASQRLGGWVVTTSTVPLSLGITFGDTNKLCFGPCYPSDNIWYRSAQFSVDYAKTTGTSLLDVQRRMAKVALQDLTLRDYLRKVGNNLNSFAAEPASFSRRFVDLNEIHFGPVAATAINRLIATTTVLLYIPFFLALLIVNVFFFPTEFAYRAEVLLLRLMTLCLFVQPFVHPSHPRYWVTFAPLMAISAGFLLRPGRFAIASSEAVGAHGERLTHESRCTRRVMVGLHVSSAVCIVAILAAVYLS